MPYICLKVVEHEYLPYIDSDIHRLLLRAMEGSYTQNERADLSFQEKYISPPRNLKEWNNLNKTFSIPIHNFFMGHAVDTNYFQLLSLSTLR